MDRNDEQECQKYWSYITDEVLSSEWRHYSSYSEDHLRKCAVRVSSRCTNERFEEFKLLVQSFKDEAEWVCYKCYHSRHENYIITAKERQLSEYKN